MAKRTEGKEFIAQILETVRNSKGGVHRAVLERLGRENGWAVKSVEQLLRTLTNTGSLSVRMAVYYSPDRLKAIEDRLGQTYIDIARVAEPSIPVIIPVKPVVPV